MPAVSKAQFKKMAVLYRQGKTTKEQFDDFDKGVDYKDLPGHSARKPPPRKRHK